MLRLLELLGGLSVAMDLGTGSALDESLKRCVVATRIARASGLRDEDVRDVVYVSLLQHLGCTAYSHELADAFGDDLSVIRAGLLADPSAPADLFRTFVPTVARGSGRSRIGVFASLVATARRLDAEAQPATCEVARAAARRLGLADQIQDALGHVTARWDGRGEPAVSRAAIPVAARVMHVAMVATLFALLEGPQGAEAELRRRAGTSLDPTLVRAVTPAMLDDLADLDAFGAVLQAEPDPVHRIEGKELERVAATFGDLADLKSPWLGGHSAAVADLAASAAAGLGLADDEIAALRLAGHLHDLGRIGVSSRIWDKPGPLTTSERAQVELHPWHTEQVLGRVPALADVARLAAQHHERLDGSGYHRGATAGQLSRPARLLAAVDRYRCLVEDRPHRPALSAAAAADALAADARAGRLDADVCGAVLEAAGHPRRARRTRPAGLTERQVDVLQLVAIGRSNKEIAAALVISPRTAEHHVQDVYARIGVSTRAGAAIFAMEHGLLGNATELAKDG